MTLREYWDSILDEGIPAEFAALLEKMGDHRGEMEGRPSILGTGDGSVSVPDAPTN
jgi:hypothetical protein